MNEKNIVAVLSFYFVLVNATVTAASILNTKHNEDWPLPEENIEQTYFLNMSGRWQKKVKKFYCDIPSGTNLVSEPELLVYGTKSWKFPLQNVTLTLGYPPANKRMNHLVTGIKVIIYLDGTECSGYITSGGLLQESIHVKIYVKNVTLLSYQFWLYGLTDADGDINVLELKKENGGFNLCSALNK